jgi:hypothetical protein
MIRGPSRRAAEHRQGASLLDIGCHSSVRPALFNNQLAPFLCSLRLINDVDDFRYRNDYTYSGINIAGRLADIIDYRIFIQNPSLIMRCPQAFISLAVCCPGSCPALQSFVSSSPNYRPN